MTLFIRFIAYALVESAYGEPDPRAPGMLVASTGFVFTAFDFLVSVASIILTAGIVIGGVLHGLGVI